MSFFNLNDRSHRRHRMLASAAVVALVASGAIGGMVMSASAPASAAAVVTSDLQSQSLPSFATVVERVKPAVVSVKRVADCAARSCDWSWVLSTTATLGPATWNVPCAEALLV